MLYAIIDIGSSIIKYKIYEYDKDTLEPVIIHDQTNGLISYRKNNKLTEEGLKVLLNTLNQFKKYSEKLHVDKSYYFATASLRNIDNSHEIISIVKNELDITINILSGEEEAQLSFNSIKWIDIPSDEGILVDMGGGSSEISIFKENIFIEEQKSIPIGVLTIYNEFVTLLYPTKEEQNIILEEITKRINSQVIGDYTKEYLYGIGKTCVTIKKLFEHMHIKTDNTNILTIEQVDQVLNILSSNTKENFKPALQVDSERIHTIVPSLLITKALAMKFNIKKIFICDVTLQDGIILDIIENN